MKSYLHIDRYAEKTMGNVLIGPHGILAQQNGLSSRNKEFTSLLITYSIPGSSYIYKGVVGYTSCIITLSTLIL